MRTVPILLFFSIIFITVLTQRVKLNITYEDKLKIRIDLTVAALELTEPKRGKRKKNYTVTKLLSRLKTSPGIIKSLRYITNRSAITVRSFVVYQKPKNPWNYLGLSIGLAGFASLLSFLRANAEEFEVASSNLNLISTAWDSPAPKINVEFSFVLIYLFISLFIFIYYKAKASMKKRRRYAGQQIKRNN